MIFAGLFIGDLSEFALMIFSEIRDLIADGGCNDLTGENSTFLGLCFDGENNCLCLSGDSNLSCENLAGVFCGVLVGVMGASGTLLEGVAGPGHFLLQGLRERGDAERGKD